MEHDPVVCAAGGRGPERGSGEEPEEVSEAVPGLVPENTTALPLQALPSARGHAHAHAHARQGLDLLIAITMATTPSLLQ